MRKELLPLFLLLFFVFNGIGNACSQNFDTISVSNKLSILNDKVFFNFPAGARNQARPVDIMSADHNNNLETRIVYDLGEMRLVFFAEELFLLGDANLFEEVKKENGRLNMERKILTDKENILSILSTPTVFDSTQNAILVNRLLVKTQDNTIIQVGAYINPKAYRLKDKYISLTEKVFKTISKGTRTANRNARMEKLTIYGTKKEFTFSLPENYCITVDQKYDFQVFKIHKYRTYLDTNWTDVTIYVGYHPSFMHKAYGLSRSVAEETKGFFLDKKVKWLSFYSKEHGVYFMEQQITRDDIGEGLILHLAMSANQGALLEELSKIIESIKLE